MNRINVLVFASVITFTTACNMSSSPSDGNAVNREIKGTEIHIVAPESYVPVCENSISVWTSVDESLMEGIHLLTCFIRQGDWKSENEITVDDLLPMMTVAIRKDMINESMTKEEFANMRMRGQSPNNVPAPSGKNQPVRDRS